MKKCKICGVGDIEYDNDICDVCGWEADTTQENNPDEVGGANEMTFNQYKQFWANNKSELLLKHNSLFAIDLSIEFYKENFQKINEEILRKEES